MLRLSLLILLVSLNALAKEVPTADCTYLLMATEELRSSLHQLAQQPAPTAVKDREILSAELKVAANVLLARTNYGDTDVRYAFQKARELTGTKIINSLYPLIIGRQPVAQLMSENLGPLSARFPRLKMSAYAIYRSNNMAKPVAYITKMDLDVLAEDEALFARLLHQRAFLHESISSALNDHREDLITLAATLVGANKKTEDHRGRVHAVLISPVVTDSFAYTHNEFRNLNREHKDFLTFFEEMKRDPDEIIFEIMHLLGIFSDQANFEN